MLRKIILFLVFLSSFYFSQAQCPVQSFSVQDTTCPLKDVEVINNDNSGSDYQWDFCTGDLFLTPSKANLTIPPGLCGFPEQMKIVSDNDKHFGFIMNNGFNFVTRVNFNGSLNNIPTYDTLTHNPLLVNMTGVDFVKENGKWLAFYIINDPARLVRAEFDSITNLSPILTVIPITGLASPLEIKLIDHYAFVTDLGGQVLRYSFNGNYLNNPSLLNPSIIAGVPFGLDVVHDCKSDSYFAFIASIGAGGVLVYDLGSNLDSVPAFVQLIILPSPARGISMAYENNEWFMATTNANDHFMLSSFGNNLNTIPALLVDTDFGGNALSLSFSCQLLKDSSSWKCFATNVTNSTMLSLFNFPTKVCNISTSWSTDLVPTGINYGGAAAGYYYYDVAVTDTNYHQHIYTDSIFITILPPESHFAVGPKCLNAPVQFYDSSEICFGNIIAWSWDFGDGNFSNIQNPTNIFGTPGKYLVSLTVYNTNNDSSSFSDSVNIVPFPVPAFTFTNNTCSRTPTHFIDLSSAPNDSIVKWHWSFGDNSTSSSQNPNHTYIASGIYDVILNVFNTGGCSDSILKKDTILSTPVPGFSFTHTCSSEATLFTNQTDSSGLSSVNYLWNFGNAQTSTQTSPSSSYSLPGSYLVILTATGLNSCFDSVTNIVSVTNKPLPNFSISNLTACTGANVVLQDISNTGADSTIYRKWDFGDSSPTDSLSTVNHIYNTPGNYLIKLTIATPSFCDTTIQKNILIVQSPVAGFTINNKCFGIPVDFTNISTASIGDPIIGFQWNFGDTTFSQAIDTVHLYAQPGAFPVTLIVTSQAGCLDSIILPASVYQVPLAGFTNYPLLCTDTIASFIDLSTIVNDTINAWAWDFGDGQFSTAQFPTNIYALSGLKLVSLLVTTNHGCTDLHSNIISVNQSPKPAITYTPTCFGASTCFTATDTNITPNNSVTWQWNFGDNTVSNLQNPCHNFSVSDTMKVTLQATDTNNCRTYRTTSVVISPLPIVGFTNTLACTGNTISFSDSSKITNGAITNWDWSINNTAVGNAPQIFYQTATSGLLPVLLTVRSDKGCPDSIIKYIQVNLSPNADFYMTPVITAPNEQVLYNNTSTNSIAYSWFFGDGSTDNNFSPSYSYSDTGLFNVKLIAYNGNGCTDTTTKFHLVVIPKVDIGIISISTSKTNGLLSVEANLFNFSNVDITNFEIIAEIQGNNGIHEFPLFYIPVGSSQKKYTFQSSIQIGSDKVEYICVEAQYPNGIPDADLSNNKKCKSFESALEILDITPNPVSDFGELHINLPTKGSAQIKIYDSKGSVVLEQQTQAMVSGFNSIPINFSPYSKGLYSLTLTFNDESRFIKIIKD